MLNSLIPKYRSFDYKGEFIACNLCEANEKTIIATRDRWLNPLTNVICNKCGLIRVDPMPTDVELEHYYRDKYRLHYQSIAEPKPESIARARRGAKKRFEPILGLLKPGARILDIGAGGGEFVAEAKRHGYEVEGVEPNVGFAQFAERKYGVKIHVAPLMKVDFESRKFDFVHSYHVFEHLRDPLASMKFIHSLLVPGGHFMCVVPDMAEKRTPTGMFHFAHVHGFTRQTMEMMLEKAGFDCVGGDPLRPGLVGRRREQPTENWFLYPEHAEMLQKKFRETTLAKHLLSAAPYRRLWWRLKRKLGVSSKMNS